MNPPSSKPVFSVQCSVVRCGAVHLMDIESNHRIYSYRSDSIPAGVVVAVVVVVDTAALFFCLLCACLCMLYVHIHTYIYLIFYPSSRFPKCIDFSPFQYVGPNQIRPKPGWKECAVLCCAVRSPELLFCYCCCCFAVTVLMLIPVITLLCNSACLYLYLSISFFTFNTVPYRAYYSSLSSSPTLAVTKRGPFFSFFKYDTYCTRACQISVRSSNIQKGRTNGNVTHLHTSTKRVHARLLRDVKGTVIDPVRCGVVWCGAFDGYRIESNRIRIALICTCLNGVHESTDLLSYIPF